MDGGKVSETGSYGELIDADGSFADFIRTFTQTGDTDEEGNPSESRSWRGRVLFLVTVLNLAVICGNISFKGVIPRPLCLHWK